MPDTNAPDFTKAPDFKTPTLRPAAPPDDHGPEKPAEGKGSHRGV